MNFVITNSDENLLNAISRPETIQKYVPTYGERMEFIANYRQYTDDIATSTSRGRVAGGSGNLKIVARIPEALMITLMAVEPNFLKDKKLFWKWLDANPEYAAYTRRKKFKSE